MPIFSDAAWAIITAPVKQYKALVKIGTPTPRYYCSRQDPVFHDAQTWIVKPMRSPDIGQGTPIESRWYLLLGDPDAEMHLDKRATRSNWTEKQLDFLVLGREQDTDSWVEIFEWVWQTTNTEYDENTGWFRINLDGAGGLRTRAGLITGNRIDFSLAPTGETTFTYGPAYDQRGFHFSGGPRRPPPDPGGEDPPYMRRAQGRLKPDPPSIYNRIIRAADIGQTEQADTGSAYS